MTITSLISLSAQKGMEIEQIWYQNSPVWCFGGNNNLEYMGRWLW